MTDWKPGDRFELEWEGVVVEFEGKRVIQVRLNDHADTLRFYTESFDAHATKTKRAFRFGDLVLFKTMSMDFPANAVVVVDETPAGLVQIWCKNAPSGESVPASHLTLMETT